MLWPRIFWLAPRMQMILLSSSTQGSDVQRNGQRRCECGASSPIAVERTLCFKRSSMDILEKSSSPGGAPPDGPPNSSISEVEVTFRSGEGKERGEGESSVWMRVSDAVAFLATMKTPPFALQKH